MTYEPAPDPEVIELLRELGEDRKQLHELSVAQARKRQVDSLTHNDTKPEPVGDVHDQSVPVGKHDVSVRIYDPKRMERASIILFFHGGGWVLGNLESHDALCRTLANYSDAMVLSVDYRLAPEHPFPAALEDCYGILEWIAKSRRELEVDLERIAVAGVSAGGNLAAAITHMANDFGGPDIAFQALLCPVLDYPFDTSRYANDRDGYLLTEADINWCWEKYLPSRIHGKNPYASPLKSREFEGLPPATVVTAELDLLRDEGRRYAERLEDAGTSVTYREYQGMIHGFMSRLTGPAKLTRAREALNVVGSDIKQAFDS